jgi:hypothetical protein
LHRTAVFAESARRSLFFNYASGLGEGRENRPQLRCGNASQTSIALRTCEQPIGSKPVKAEVRLRALARSNK